MNYSNTISRSEFERTLSGHKVRTLQMVYGALVSGILLFAVVIALVLSGSHQEPSAGTDILLLLSGVHGVMALTIYTVAPLVFRKQLSLQNEWNNLSGEDLVSVITGKIITAQIIRMAMYEGTAIYGLVICLLSIVWGHVSAQPEFLLNGITAVLFVAMAAVTFPTRERLADLYAQYFSAIR